MPITHLKKITIATSILLITIVGVYFFAGTGHQRDSNINLTGIANSVNSKTNTKEDGLEYVTTDSSGLITYRSQDYGFDISFPREFSYGGYAILNTEKFTYKFSRPNKNTSEVKNRNTPVGYNTAAEDIILFSAYSNSEHFNRETSVAIMKDWIVRNEPNEIPVESIEKVSGIYPIFYSEQMNGVGGAVGECFYVLAEKNIYLIQSNDVPKDELKTIVDTMKLL